MSLSIGIVGLPNVGKSTLFNAITTAQAEAQNYPFCTIEPNTGIVSIPDPRLDVLSQMSRSKKTIPATITFTDIAGLVKGASQGEGLGNKFLSHIREVSAIAHVVRCFEDDNITHVGGRINPQEDIEVINTELIIADLEMAEKMAGTMEKQVKRSKDQDSLDRFELLIKIKDALAQNQAVRSLPLTGHEQALLKSMNFLSHKKVIYLANIAEAQIGQPNPLADQVQAYAQAHRDEFAVICGKVEEELSKLASDEKAEFLKALGISESGLDVVAKKCFSLLGLQTYLTTGEKETRAWTIHAGDTAPQAAGVIHSDFERGFIRANIVSYEEFVKLGGWKEAREKGALRQEGKDYVMHDGDVVEFLFNV